MMRTHVGSLLGLLLLAVPVRGAVVLEKTISREHPLLAENGKAMTVGRDGKVYVNSGGYLLRMNPDGTQKVGVQLGAGLNKVAPDARGNFAAPFTPHRHRKVVFFGADFQPLGSVGGFLSGEHMNWASPSDVQCGESGQFYAVDQHRNQILRMELPGRTNAVYSLAGLGISVVDTEPLLGVVESLQRFYIAVNNQIYALGFDGKLAWTIPAKVVDSEDVFDSDDAGNVYVLPVGADTINVWGPDGKPRDPIKLQMADQLARSGRDGEYLSLKLFGDEVFLKRHRMADRTELFQVYDRKTGMRKRIVNADAERVRVEFPSAVWTAGEPVPVTIALQDNRPSWPVRIARCNESDWIALPVVDGKITPPADAAGLYAVRVGYADTTLETMVEIRVPGSKGTVNIFTPLNRVYYGRGEAIPISVIVRGPGPDKVKLELRSSRSHRREEVATEPNLPTTTPPPHVGGYEVVWSTNFSLSASSFILHPSSFRPGHYRLTADVPGFTVASQPLIIGPGLREKPIFHVVQGGDGGGITDDSDAYQAPEAVAAYIEQARRIGVNLSLNRVGYMKLTGPTGLEAYAKQLEKDPLGIAPEKARLEKVGLQITAANGAFGIEQQMILLHMDTMIPFLPEGSPNTGGMIPRTYLVAQSNSVASFSQLLLPYPAFRGWTWACNWWIDMEGTLGKATEKENEAARSAITKRFDNALEKTGKWDPEFEKLSEPWVRVIPDAERQLNTALQAATPGKINAATGPYRQPWIIPPVTFANVAEVDLFLQSEQVPPPYFTPHNVDFYKRPGKRAFGHVESGTEDGQGFSAAPPILLQAMRGPDGTGWEGRMMVRPTGRRGNSTTGMDNDARSTGQGIVSIYRAMSQILRRYGPWLTTLQGNDHIAIVVSTRMLRTDNWGGGVVGAGRYFNRLFEAYTTCLFAHRPAVFVFTEDLQADTLKKFKAVLVVDQQFELDPPLADVLKNSGVPVFYDGTCRPEHVASFKPLNVTFDRLEHEHLMNNDSVYWGLPRMFERQAAALKKTIGDIVPTVAGVDNPEIMLTERRNGEGRFIWAINNDTAGWEPGSLWRVANFITTRVGQKLPMDLNAKGQTVYDLFAMKEVKGDVVADLQQMPARLFAILPKPIQSLKLDVRNGDPLSWSISIDGPKTTYPIHVRLLDEGGAVIEESFPTNMTGTITIPINVGKNLTLEARELISGKSAQAAVNGSPRRKEGESSPVESLYGPHLRDIAISADGSTALINAMNWEENYYVLDARTGSIRTQGNVGQQFAFGPVATSKGFFVQGYDVSTGGGYHLYDLGTDGKPTRRFALYGLPDRWQGWRGMGILSDRMNNFAVSPKADWIATASNLGLIVWDKAGKKLWSQDWWQTTRKEMFLLVPDDKTLVTLTDMTMTAYQAATGKKLWEVKLGETGLFEGGAVSADGRTLATYTQVEGGKVFVVRDGKLLNSFPILADNIYLTPDGRHLLMSVGGNELRCFATDGGLEWAFDPGDSIIAPRISPDGQKIAVGGHDGSLYILDNHGQKLFERDFGAVPVASWLNGGDLLVATWMGNVVRLGADGTEKWRTHLTPQQSSRLAAAPVAENLPTIKPVYGNASSEPSALTPNLLAQTKATFAFTQAQTPFQNLGLRTPTDSLMDGQPQPPAEPWLHWVSMSGFDFYKTALVVDAQKPLRVTGVTFVEDAAHPESWLRDMRMQIWDAATEKWFDGPYLLSDSATHTHRFEKPVEGTKFRFIGTGNLALEWRWPISNIRLGEIVFHGEILN